MQKKSQDFFVYPPNIHVLDLASMVSMYRSRGEPRRAPSGEYYACAKTKKLVKEAKTWFGLYYSQSAWDQLLTKHSSGYPMTEVEFTILGLTVCPPEDKNHRSFIESNAGIVPQLAFLIVNDLRQFGFLQEFENGMLGITNNGQLALDGFSKRVYDRKFSPDMLTEHGAEQLRPRIEVAEKKDHMQTRLF